MLRLALLLACFLAASSTARADSPATVTPGAFTWGVSATFPPFESVQDGKLVGFDVDLADLLSKRLGLTTTPMTFEFSGLIAALLGHRIDAVISGMYVNPQRQEVADFVVYMIIGNQIIVRHGNPLKLTDLNSLCGHRIAVPVGTVFETQANQANDSCTEAGRPAVTILDLPGGTTSCVLALSQGRADAVIASSSTLVSLSHDRPDEYDAAGPPFDNDTKVGIAVAKGNPALSTALQTAMRSLVADGSYAALLSRWGFPPQSSPF